MADRELEELRRMNRAGLYRTLIAEIGAFNEETTNAALAAVVCKDWPLVRRILRVRAKALAKLRRAAENEWRARTGHVQHVAAGKGVYLAHNGGRAPDLVELTCGDFHVEAVDGSTVLLVNHGDDARSTDALFMWW
jgi:hypothetical protein